MDTADDEEETALLSLQADGDGDDDGDSSGDGSNSSGDGNESTGGGDTGEQERSFVHALSYAVSSFCAVLRPVSITIVLASLVVTHVQDGQDSASSELDVYTVYNIDSSSGDSTASKLGKSLVNAVIIVSVLAAATFCIVCLYKYRCTNILVGYMAFSSMTLLGLMGGQLWFSFLQMYQLPCDSISFGVGCVNFAVVGVIAIFKQTGIPKFATQAYLVCTSVLMAWQLSKFEEWTGWCLLAVLAIYDLCAVLTPCGPLRALVNLMQKHQTPLPGLLYQADISQPPVPRRARAPAKETELWQGEGKKAEYPETLRSPAPAQVHEVDDRSEEPQGQHENSIKLGIGDFVFYSVLTSKATLSGFAPSAICFLVVISGLGATLILLSVHEKALPALPISIALGLCFFALSRAFVVPFVAFLEDSIAYV
jgi:presenilin 1